MMKAQMPQAPGATPPPPIFGQGPQQKKPQAKSTQPTFMGQQDIPQPGQLGAKTLLGQ